NYAGLAIFTALAVATNFTAVLVMAAEAIWLIYLYLSESRNHEAVRITAPWLMGAALIAAMVLLLPFYPGLRYGVEGVKRGDYNWIKPPGRWEPFATFEGGLGSWPFPLFVLFAIAGGVRLWRSNRDEAGGAADPLDRTAGDRAVRRLLPGYANARDALSDILFRPGVYTHCNRH
ncbi:MAG: hypothetical protein ABSD30_19110, partial [Candidatus Binatus sp.]